MKGPDARDMAGLDENLGRLRKRMLRVFLGAFVLSGSVIVLLILTHTGGAARRRTGVPLIALLCWSLIVSAYAFNSLRVFGDEIALQLARNQFLDPLTEAFNVRYIGRRLKGEEERVKRHGGTASVLYLDLDHFKQVNDTHGHHVGNVVLQGLVMALAGQIREYDTLGRIGGDEFLVLLPNTSLAEAQGTAERLRASIEAYSLSMGPHGDIDFVRVSIGAGAYPDTGDCMDCVVAGADKAVYEVKRRGGNGVAQARPVRACSLACRGPHRR